MKWLTAFLFLLLSITVYADIFQTKDQNGNIIYSDIPFDKNSKKIENMSNPSSSQISSFQENVPNQINAQVPVNPVKAMPLNPNTVRKPYTTFLIVWPRDQETIQNQPVFYVQLKIDPPLQLGDKIQVYIDGAAISSPIAGTEMRIENLNRGQHTVSAAIIDINGNTVIAAKSNTIFNHRAHLGVPPS